MFGNSSGRVGFYLSRAALLTSIASIAYACGDDHNHGHHQNSRRSTPFSSWSLTPPSRPLEWGDLNVLHTTDTHGWLLGHQKLSSPPEPNYSGTLGDFADFVQHMKRIADEKGVDLLLVDSGDVHDGTGLSDGFPSGGVDAHDSNQFLKQLPYDLLAIGNHELYIYNNTLDTHNDFAPHWQGRYLSSNVNITIPDPSDPSQNASIPVGERYVKFKTKFGRRVTSLGVLYDFTGNDVGTTVQKVEDMVKEQWFVEAIAEEPDLFLLVGHMPVQEDNWPTVFEAVRAVHPTTPILIFGGHTHIRDCVQFDDRSMALESGRYMETVGWMSVKLDSKTSSDGSPGNLTFSRRYLDANRLTYEFHSGRNNHTFDTSFGQSMTRGLEDLAERFDLNFTFGISPRDYSISRDPYPSNGSSLTLFIEQAVPIVLSLNNTLSTSNTSNTNPALFLTNSGSQRFDIFKGPFTKNDELTASPFADAFLFIRDVQFGIAKQVVGVLNVEGGEVFTVAGNKRELSVGKKEGRWMEELYKRGDVEMRYRAWLAEMYARAKEVDLERRQDTDTEDTESVKTLGYVTSDSCPGVGDDTPHIPLPFFPSPAYISSIDSSTSNSNSNSSSSSSSTNNSLTPSPPSQLTSVTDSTPIDLVFVDFIASDVLSILNQLGSESESGSGAQGNASGSGRVYSEEDVERYSDLLANEVWGVFARQVWS